MNRPTLHARTALFATLLLIALPMQAWGDSKVQGYLVSVGLFYEELEYEKALEQITQARLLPCTQEEDAALSLYEGIILADLSRWKESSRAFKKALSLRPAAMLPLKVSPKVERHFEAVRRETQKVSSSIRATTEPLPPAEKSLQGAQPSLPPTPTQVQATPMKGPAAAPQAQPSQFQRARVLIPAVSGGVLVAAGGTSWMLSRRELSRMRNNDPGLALPQDRQSSASRGRTYQSVGAGLLGAGVVSLGVAAGLYVLGMPSDTVTLGLSADTPSAAVSVRWP